jgi:uncharacterized iron-regulated protein
MLQRRFFAPVLFLAFLPSLIPAPASSQEEPQIISASTLGQVSLSELAKDLQEARFIFVGEHHDSAVHHAMQLQILRLLKAKGVKIGVALEMFSHEDGEALERWVAGDLEALEFYDLYVRRWNAEQWPLYGDILHYAREHGIPIAGINVPKKVVAKFAEGGFASLEENEKLGITGIECDAGSKYLDLIREAMSGGAREERSLRRFCETQIFWDTSMAVNLLRVAEKRPDHVWMIMAGIFHSWKHGIPAQLARRSDAPLRVVLPSSDSSYLAYDIPRHDADYIWWVAEPGVQP